MSIKTPTESLALLQKVNSVFLGTRDFKQLSERAVRLMTDELKGEGVLSAVIYRINPEEGMLAPYAFSTRMFAEVDKLFPQRFSELKVSLSESANLLIKAIATRREQEGDRLYDFVRPVINETTASVIQRIVGGKHGIAYPLRLKQSKVAGVLFFALENQTIGHAQRILLEAFRSQLELAFENVIEFEHVSERYQRMVAKTFEKTHEENIPTVRFTLRITPKQNDTLDRLAKEKATDKASLIRSLLDKSSGS